MRMKDKKAVQEADREKHRLLLKSSRRNEPDLKRREPDLVSKPFILIVCEGQNTEPSYFYQFRLSSATVKAIGEGYNTTTLVHRAIELSNESKIPYEQVWCVFDKDDNSDEIFNEAICLAEQRGFKVAYSNQAFEYWLILHFNDHQGGGILRERYASLLNRYLNKFNLWYDPERKIITEGIFNVLEGFDAKYKKSRRVLAVDRAERNYNRLSHANPASEESSTTVFRLVEELMKFV